MFDSEESHFTSQVFQQQKKKKKNLKPLYRELLEAEKNSLLNFQLTDNQDHHEHRHVVRASEPKHLSFYEKKQLKQNYLQGNFRFLVNPDYEENITYVDPNHEIKWKTIEKVKYITSSLIGCPICLNDHNTMVFPKITRCGHIFCWPCVLRYLTFQNSQPCSKCPLCDDFLMHEDLRTVQILYHPAVKIGDKIRLKLMRRRLSENTLYNGHSLTEEEDFIRIKKIGWNEILTLKEEETSSLLDYLNILEMEGDDETRSLIEKAINHLGSSIERIQSINVPLKKKKSKLHEERKNLEAPNEEEFLYFYQEINGLNIFLHPLNNKYIKLQFGDYKSCPSLIEAPLIESKGFQQSELTQRRYKFLNHLPLNSDIIFAEIDLKDILSEDLFHSLADEMKNYKENNAKKDMHTKPFGDQTINKLPPKSMTVPSEGKYKIEFPMSPSGLNLDDKFDYPELTKANSHLPNNIGSGWECMKPLKKKAHSSINSQGHVGSKSTPLEKENEQQNQFNSHTDLNNETVSKKLIQ